RAALQRHLAPLARGSLGADVLEAVERAHAAAARALRRAALRVGALVGGEGGRPAADAGPRLEALVAEPPARLDLRLLGRRGAPRDGDAVREGAADRREDLR